MLTKPETFRFGPFELDRRRLTRAGTLVSLPTKQMDLLRCLVDHAGELVDKQTLIDFAWNGDAITDNALAQNMARLRRALGSRPAGESFIETHTGKGYRLVVPRAEDDDPGSDIDVAAILGPHQAFVEGRLALETLHLDSIEKARQAFEEALRLNALHGPAHIGMANVLLLRYESTRADMAPDVTSLQKALHHAREACRLNDRSADAWGTVALIRQRLGDGLGALAAARHALGLGSGEWRHDIRIAYVSWGEERLAAADRALGRCVGLALGHWFAATSYVPRQMFDRVTVHLRAAGTVQRGQGKDQGMFTAAGLHLLMGLVLLAQGADDAALVELQRELDSIDLRHVYGCESHANTWYAIGAIHLRNGRIGEARVAFENALKVVPSHPLAMIGLGAAAAPTLLAARVAQHAEPKSVDEAMAMAAALAVLGRHGEAARLVEQALERAEPGSAGWMLPVEPLINCNAHPDVWAPALAMVRARAM